MRVLLVNCTQKESPERETAIEVVRMLEVSFEAIGVTTDVALPSDLWSPVDLVLTEPDQPERPVAAGLPSNWVTQALLQSRILVIVLSPASTFSTDLASRTLARLGSVLDRARGAGVKVGAPLSIEGWRADETSLLGVCCRLMDVGYVVPEQAWRDWRRYPLARRTVRAANDLTAIAAALGAATAGETISSYPPFAGRHPPQSVPLRR